MTRVQVGMLSKNFQVCCQILSNIAKNSSSILHFSKKVSRNGKFIDWPKENEICLTPDQYRKKLEQYPKSSFVQFCCKKLFFKSKPKVNHKLLNFIIFFNAFQLFNESMQIG